MPPDTSPTSQHFEQDMCAVAFPQVDVSDWEVDADEPAGAEEKLWLQDPAEQKWLFKPVTIKYEHRQGEDWAEKAACHLAQAMTIPCAEVDLAQRSGVEGSVSLNLRPSTHHMQPGMVYLQARDTPGYEPGNVPGRPGHSVSNIKRALDGASPPPDSRLPAGFTAFDAFCGYLIFDAWIANRDRHDENWSVLVPQTSTKSIRLCSSYDHASSLGFNLRDAERTDRLGGSRGGVEAWARRGTAWRFEHDPAGTVPTLVTTAVQALSLATRDAKNYWMDQIHKLDDVPTRDIFEKLGTMSHPARTFALTLLEINARRLRDECRN